MVQRFTHPKSFLKAPKECLFPAQHIENDAFPLSDIKIDWQRLIAKRPIVLETVGEMPPYLLMPEILTIIRAEKDPTRRLMLDLLWWGPVNLYGEQAWFEYPRYFTRFTAVGLNQQVKEMNQNNMPFKSNPSNIKYA